MNVDFGNELAENLLQFWIFLARFFHWMSCALLPKNAPA